MKKLPEHNAHPPSGKERERRPPTAMPRAPWAIAILQGLWLVLGGDHVNALTRQRRILTGPTNPVAPVPSVQCQHDINLSTATVSPIIESPNYPYNYLPNVRCRWTISAPFGNRIRLLFDSFTLQPQNLVNGCTDYLEIKDITRTTRYCGINSPGGGVYTSLGPLVELNFVTDATWEYAGFSLRVGSQIIPCGGVATNPQPGTIASPNYPRSYVSNALCAWKIKSTPGTFIRLNCSKKFALESSDKCRNDFLLISTSGDETLNNSKRYCGSKGPGILKSQSNSLTMMFRADGWYNFLGFSCKYDVLDSKGQPINTGGNPISPVPEPKCDCGKMSSRPKRIVGGELVTQTLPWLVAITSRFGQLVCGGVLITPRYVLTAGHCLNGLVPSNMSVAIETYLPYRWANNRLLPVQEMKVHPKLHNFDYDVALLKIPDVRPGERPRRCVCLPPEELVVTGHKALVYGWGRDSKSGRDDRLRRVEVPIHNDSLCRDVFNKLIRVTPRMFCAGEDYKDACEGDSGGPLLLDQLDGRQTVIGLVSFGRGCGVPGFPGVYTKVTEVVQWIRENAGITCT